jgi:hypothetical protein
MNKDKKTNSIFISNLYDDLCPSENEARQVSYSTVAVKRDGKWGLRSVLNEEITPLLYDEVKTGIGYNFIVGNNSKYGVINENGEETVAILFDEIDGNDYSNGYRVRQGRKWGLLTRSGDAILVPDYDDVDPATHYMYYAATVTLNNKKGVVDSKGNFVIPIEYEDIVLFPGSFNTFGVRINGKWRLITRLLEPITGETYDDIKPLQWMSTLGVKQNGQWRIINFDGKDCVPYRFEEIDCRIGFHTGKINGCWGIIDKRGNVCLPFEYDTVDVEFFEPASDLDSKYRIRMISDYRFKFTKGDYAGESIYESNSYIMLELNNGKCGCKNKSGETIVPFDYDVILCGGNPDCIPALKNGKWGYIDINNNTVLPFIYDSADGFNADGYAAVKLQGKYGFINRQGEFVIPPRYNTIYHTFEHGLAEVELVRSRIMIDKNGNPVRPEKQRIFVLTVFYVVTDCNKTVENYEDLMPKYPEYKVWSKECGFYSTLKNAEDAMRRHIEKMKKHDWNYIDNNKSRERLNDLFYRNKEDNYISTSDYGKIHSYRIEEVKVDEDSGTIGRGWDSAETRRSYLPDGTLWAENLTSETEDFCLIDKDKEYDRETMQRLGAFVGRTPEEIRFKNGDIVEVLHSTSVTIGIVWRCPATIEERKQRWTDSSDDIYLVLGNDESIYNFKKGDKPHYIDDMNSYPVIVFNPKFPVPEELAESLRLGYEYWISDESVEVEKQWSKSHDNSSADE